MLRLVDPLLFVLASATHDELAREVQFFRAENRMLRERLPNSVRLTETERRKLVRLCSALGTGLRANVSATAVSVIVVPLPGQDFLQTALAC